MRLLQVDKAVGSSKGLSRWLKHQNRRLTGKMLGIGDGANDVAMIQAADVGIGIMGKEGRQASLLAHLAAAMLPEISPSHACLFSNLAAHTFLAAMVPLQVGPGPEEQHIVLFKQAPHTLQPGRCCGVLHLTEVLHCCPEALTEHPSCRLSTILTTPSPSSASWFGFCWCMGTCHPTGGCSVPTAQTLSQQECRCLDASFASDAQSHAPWNNLQAQH